MNRSPNRSLNLKFPLEIWSNKKPDFGNLRIFGCATYAHSGEGKLDPRTLKCVFLSYQDSYKTKGYRLWEKDIARGIKVIVTRDVVFDESKFPYITMNQIKLRLVV